MSSLRPYQQEGVNGIFTSWKDGNRNVMYQLVTGGGKTVLFVDIIKKFIARKKRVILLAHREELITQAWAHLHKNSIYAGIIKSGVTPNYDLPCQVASIQTCARRKKLPHADLVIFDEAHHCQEDNSYGNLLVEHFPSAYVLGVTATPYRLGGKGFTNLFNTMISGPTFKSLVSSGYLTPLRYFVASVPDLTGVKIKNGEYDNEASQKVMELAPIVESYLEHCQGMRGVVFAVNVAHSHNIVTQYNSIGVRSAHLDANTHPEERKGILAAFRMGSIRIISNVGIITEGFDFPDMEFVQLARPTKSLSLFLQMVGRVTRTDYESIKSATDDETRAYLVSQSKKPYGLVLDNAGLYQEHGLPDQEFDWNEHFVGREKRRKTKATEMMEIIEFVAEDEEGRVVRTQNPVEVDGLKLIEVNKSIREQIVNLTSLKKFDEIFDKYRKLAQNPRLKIKKPGFLTYNEYKKFCLNNRLFMSAEVWAYMIRRLSSDVAAYVNQNAEKYDMQVQTIRTQYGETDDAEQLITPIRLRFERNINLAKDAGVPESFLKKEMAAYLSQNQVPA